MRKEFADRFPLWTVIMLFSAFFPVSRSLKVLWHPSIPCLKKRSFFFVMKESNGNERMQWNGENEDEDENNAPYKHRSISWTRRYRTLIPYEKARVRAMSLGLRSVDDWDDYLQDGKVFQHGPYLPTRPDLMYPNDWVSWEEFLGIMRSYDDAKSIVKLIGLHNQTEYEQFVLADPKRAEGLRIPARPEIVYKEKGWVSYDDYVGLAS